MQYKRVIFIFFIFFSFLYSKQLTHEELQKKPTSIVKDYYIYRLLQDSKTTQKEAASLYLEVRRMSPKLFNSFAMKMKDDEVVQKEYRCKRVNAKDLLKEDEECILMQATPSFVYEYDKKTKLKLAKKIEKNSPFTASWIRAMSEESLFTALKKSGAKEFLHVFNSLSKEIRVKKLDFALPYSFIEELEKEPSYETFLKHVVLGTQYLENIPSSLLYFSKNSTLSHTSYFLLGLNSAKHKKNNLADFLFSKANERAYYKNDKDKSIFWRYLVTNNEELLLEVAQSFDLNIYSLYARELLKIQTTNVNRIDINETNSKKIKYDMQDPFAWNELLETIKASSDEQLQELAKIYKTPETLPIYAFIQERLAKYKEHYFIFPYYKNINFLSKERQALLLSIARQESRFIPSAISTSYALGMMQFMPFLAEDIAKKKNLIGFDIDDMFDPSNAFSFGDYHIDYLSNYLNHPLFIAYAYNGGIGFTRRTLKSGMFKKGPYEPFMSIEGVAYAESREYGKKVMANYVIYMKFLGEEVSIKSLFEELIKPAKTD